MQHGITGGARHKNAELRAAGAPTRIPFCRGEKVMPLPEFKQLVDEAKLQISEINPDELKQMQQSGEDFTLIDVRERDEQQKGMIPGAVAMPRGILEVNIDQITTDKDRQLVLYCGGGSRSALAALNLKKMGFNKVLSMSGGYRGWQQSETQ
jgi:rhodanese-related sulfurtransferase